jgi:hypothetical protein
MHTTQRSFWGPNFGTWQPKKKAVQILHRIFWQRSPKVAIYKIKKKIKIKSYLDNKFQLSCQNTA